MLNKNRLFSMSSLAVLLACGFACAQENPKSHNNTKTADAANTATHTAPAEAAKAAVHVNTATPLEAEQVKVVPSTTASDTLSKDDIVRASEAFGHFIGRNLKAPGVNFDLESIIKGMREGAAGKPAPMKDKEYEELMSKIQEQAYKQLADENLKAANDFMAKNAKADNLVVIEPGKLEYIRVQEGQGAAVAEHSAPLVKYSGKYLDGTTFGSSEETGGPISLPLDQTIPGIIKSVVGMKEGEKRKIFVHPDLGYGTTGQLPPNSLLIFEVEVIKADSPDFAADADDDFSELSLDDLADNDDEDDRFSDDDSNAQVAR
jgi:peptidylprolyl isomerase